MKSFNNVELKYKFYNVLKDKEQRSILAQILEKSTMISNGAYIGYQKCSKAADYDKSCNQFKVCKEITSFILEEFYDYLTSKKSRNHVLSEAETIMYEMYNEGELVFCTDRENIGIEKTIKRWFKYYIYLMNNEY